MESQFFFFHVGYAHVSITLPRRFLKEGWIRSSRRIILLDCNFFRYGFILILNYSRRYFCLNLTAYLTAINRTNQFINSFVLNLCLRYVETLNEKRKYWIVFIS